MVVKYYGNSVLDILTVVDLQVFSHGSFQVRFRFASSPFQIRFKSLFGFMTFGGCLGIINIFLRKNVRNVVFLRPFQEMFYINRYVKKNIKVENLFA